MLTDTMLASLATRLQTTTLNIRREYVQHLFLSYLYQQPETDHIYFKGGTALRMLYHSPRFSEDLDFSSSVRSIRVIEAAILETLAAMTRENLVVDLDESKETTGGYLAIVKCRMGETTVTLQIEISLRERALTGEAVTIVSDFVPAYLVVALAKERLISEKMRALTSRKKARDFYDLYFILRANLLPARSHTVLAAALQVLRESKIDFEKELKEFLPKSHWAIIRDFPASLEREIERFL
jgi:predicted nucleotidyltransferase component of viral defense system